MWEPGNEAKEVPDWKIDISLPLTSNVSIGLYLLHFTNTDVPLPARKYIPYSRKIWRILNLVKWRKKAVFWYWRNLNLAICNCTYDVSTFTLWRNRCTFSVWHTLVRQKLRMETFEVNSCIRGYHVFLEPNLRGRIELCARKDKHWRSLRCGCDTQKRCHVPQKMPATCALFLRQKGRDHPTWSTSTSTV